VTAGRKKRVWPREHGEEGLQKLYCIPWNKDVLWLGGKNIVLKYALYRSDVVS